MGYTQAYSLTIDHTQCGASNSSNFPVLVAITDASLKSLANGGYVQDSAGADIIFYSDHGTTQIASEIDFYDPVAGTLYAWVLLATVSHTTDTVFYMYYGNSAPPTRTANPWDSNFKGVYHLGNGTTLSAVDSTTNAKNGTITAATAGAGQIDGAAAFNGSSAFVSLPNLGISGSTARTVSFWMKPTNATGRQELFCSGHAVDYQLFNVIYNLTNAKNIYVAGQNSDVYSAANGITLSVWNHVAVVYDGASILNATNGHVYINGSAVSLTNAGAQASNLATTDQNYALAKDVSEAGTNYFNGSLDEMRIAAIARSADWILAEYNNQKTSSTFITYARILTAQMLTVRSAIQATTQKTLAVKSKITGNFSVVVNGVDVYSESPGRIYDGQGNAITFTLPQGQRGTAQITLVLTPTDAFTASRGQQVFIFSFGTRMYAGTIDHVQKNWIGQDGTRVLVLSCVSFEQEWDTLICYPPRAYTNKTCGFIFTDLFSAYCFGVPFQIGTVEDGPVVDTFTVSGDRLSDVFARLATIAGFVVGVDPRSLTAYFQSQNSFLAPFTFSIQDLQWETAQLEQSRDNYRNGQFTRMSFQQNLPSNTLFIGDDVTKIFTFPYIPAQLLSVADTTSTQATCTCTFTGVPADGDYTSVGTALQSVRYTFKTTIDNATPYEVLIAATAAGNAQNLADAINQEPSTGKTSYSWPTLEHPTLNAGTLTGAAFPVLTKVPGTGGTLVQVTSSAAFSWGSAADGTDGTTGQPQTAGKDYVWPTLT